MPSRQYEELRSRVEDLKGRFVGVDPPLDRDPTVHELDSIAAFRLLVHAEVEMFIEDRVRYAISVGSVAWQSRRIFGKCLLNIMIKYLPNFGQPGKSTNPPSDSKELDERIESCFNEARAEVDKNNSIKRDAFVRMAVSAGMLADDIPEALLTALDGYGRQRGDVAHRGIGQVRNLDAPSVEGGTAMALVILLEDFDKLIEEGALV